ncbi:MAG: hypothetical protein JWO82_757 [Akkermansiaceae bacterium]|nr:hypothetical protein [Akkermansiaceae bacterium]
MTARPNDASRGASESPQPQAAFPPIHQSIRHLTRATGRLSIVADASRFSAESPRPQAASLPSFPSFPRVTFPLAKSPYQTSPISCLSSAPSAKSAVLRFCGSAPNLTQNAISCQHPAQPHPLAFKIHKSANPKIGASQAKVTQTTELAITLPNLTQNPEAADILPNLTHPRHLREMR